jgi:TfoX/Sxy family transcriptional regulator of competence genes
MAYDEELAARIRELVAGEPALTEKKMFGGLAFLIGGNMAVAASGQGGLLVRVDPEESETLVGSSPARLMEMRGREMQGWLRLDSDQVATKEQLSPWVERGVAYARSLPAKQ